MCVEPTKNTVVFECIHYFAEGYKKDIGQLKSFSFFQNIFLDAFTGE